MNVSPQISYVEILMLNVMVLEIEALEDSQVNRVALS